MRELVKALLMSFPAVIMNHLCLCQHAKPTSTVIGYVVEHSHNAIFHRNFQKY